MTEYEYTYWNWKVFPAGTKWHFCRLQKDAESNCVVHCETTEHETWDAAIRAAGEFHYRDSIAPGYCGSFFASEIVPGEWYGPC